MNQVAQKKTTQVVVSELDKMLEADSGVGLENITTEDMQIPFIRIIKHYLHNYKRTILCISKVLSKAISSILSRKRFTSKMKVYVVPAFFEKNS